MFKLAIDIGYSNLKLAFVTDGDSPRCELLPAGAAPLDHLPERLDGGGEDGLCVDVNGTPYAAGVPQSRIQRWNRTLHEDYPSTLTYRALFHAGLLLSGVERVDLLVTGLPVNQYQEGTERREALAETLRGRHRVTPKREVEVCEVKVVPQPTGAYMDLIYSLETADSLDDARVLVADPGFFSFDWVVIEDGAILQSVSDTSKMASSMILEAVQSSIRTEHGGNVGLGKLEHAIRSRRGNIMLFGQPIALKPYLNEACGKVVPTAMDALRQSLRADGASFDIILLAGGGAQFYEPAFRELFPKTRVVVPEHPVLANVRGFARF